MLPVYLSVEGLYSYQKKQEIDFTQLTEAGLFGIFGHVGSGKSSILEAISFALYGETERLNKQEKRSYNMLNLKSDNAIIDFQFLNFEGKKYRFVAQWKRKKRFEETSTIERYAYIWENDQWIPLESADGAKVTNLSYPNFRRTIIIPQGQFKEFLELKGKDRSDMMKEIFNLNQYDLGPKVSILQAENNKKLEHLNGVLSGFENISQEIIVQKQAEQSTLQNDLNATKQVFESLEKQLKSYEEAQNNRADLASKQNQLAQLELEKDNIKQLESKIEAFEIAVTHFREPINLLNQLDISKTNLLAKIQKLDEQKSTIQSNILDLEAKIANIQMDVDKLDESKNILEDYKLLLANYDFVEHKSQEESRIPKGIEELNKQKQEEIRLMAELESAENMLAQLKSNKMNTSELLAIESWYQQNDIYIHKINETTTRITSEEKDIAQMMSNFKELELDITNWQNQVQIKKNNLEQRKKNLRDKEADLRLKKELAQYANSLQNHEPCPLCGSLEHPSPMHLVDLSELSQDLADQTHELKDQENALNNLEYEALKIQSLYNEKLKIKERLIQELEELNNLSEIHQSKFTWEEFDPHNSTEFDKKKAEITVLEHNIGLQEESIKKLYASIQLSKDKIVKYDKAIEALKTQIAIYDAKINQNIAQIRVLTPLQYSNLSKDELLENFNSLSTKTLDVEQKYNAWNLQLNTDKNQLATLTGQFSETEEQLRNVESRLNEALNSVENLLAQFMYKDLEEVKIILNQDLNVTALKTQVQQYHLESHSLTTRIHELIAATQHDNYDEEIHARTKDTYVSKKQELEFIVAQLGALNQEVKRLMLEFEKKSSLLEELSKLQSRRDNLRILDNMFKGNGFVNYVSSIHLERLCEIANHRFHRLTKNQLSLVINESNEFEVIDYLNNGHRRSVKTLSGGQGFQASLCLALALAENIQSLNKADKNFFFIDEGFGTQDADSIHTVFDTLQYLQHENRIVGVISHVDELKEKLPRSITVIKDPDKGSILM